MAVELAFRWMHIVAAILAVGGTWFMCLALAPAASAQLDQSTHEKLREAIRSRWAKWVHLAIAFLLVSGVYNLVFVVVPKKDVPGFYHMLFGIKFLLAIVMFGLSSMIVGRSAGAQKLRQNMPFWLKVNSTIALVVVLLSGVLKVSHTGVPIAPPSLAETSSEPSAPTP